MECMAYIDAGRILGTKNTVIGGFLLTTQGTQLDAYSEKGGKGSSTDGDWQSLIRCLTLAVNHGVQTISVRTDNKTIVDAFTDEYEVLISMVARLEREPENIGLRKALRRRTGQDARDLERLRRWLQQNRAHLKSVSEKIPVRYRARIVELMTKLHVTVEWIPGEANPAHALVVEAKDLLKSRATASESFPQR